MKTYIVYISKEKEVLVEADKVEVTHPTQDSSLSELRFYSGAELVGFFDTFRGFNLKNH